MEDTASQPIQDIRFAEHHLVRPGGITLHCREIFPSDSLLASEQLATAAGNGKPVETPVETSNHAAVGLSSEFSSMIAPENASAEWPGETVLFVHGACEYGGRHVEFAERGASVGWRVWLPDLRGHGNSTGDVVHVDRFEHYFEDLQALCEEKGFDPARTVLMGNSMGGLIVIRWLQHLARQGREAPCHRVCLLSPLLGIRHPIAAWKKMLASMIGHLLPRTQFRSTIRAEDLSHDEEVTRQRRLDQKIRRAVTARWYLEVERALAEAFEESAHYRIPTDIFQAGEDVIVDPLAARAWAERVNESQGESLIQFHLLSGWYHELLKESEGPRFQQALWQYLRNPQLPLTGTDATNERSAPFGAFPEPI